MCAARSNAESPCAQTTLHGAPDEPRSFPLFADGGDTDNIRMERAITGGLATRIQDGETTPPVPVATDCAAKISGEGVDVSDDWNLQYDRTAPIAEEDSDEEEPPVRFNAIEMDATQLPLTQRVVKQVGAELATPSFGLQVNASMGSYREPPHDLDIEANPGDSQGGFSIPMDEVELEPSFGVLPNTTFDPLPAYHPHLFDHSINNQQDDLVGEDNNLADLAMEDVGTEAERAIRSATTTKSPKAFSWIPPSVSSAFHAIFPGVSSTHTVALANGSIMGSPMLSNPYSVDMTTSEGVGLQHTRSRAHV